MNACFTTSLLADAGSVLSVALGGQHSLALSDLSAACGRGTHILPEEHQIYTDDDQQEAEHPEFSSPVPDPSPHMGSSHLFSWGMGDFGCLGQQHFTSELQPTPVQTFEALISHHSDAMPVVNSTPAVAAAGAHSLLVDRCVSFSNHNLPGLSYVSLTRSFLRVSAK